MQITVHNHFNARRLCLVEISDQTAALIDKPPPLKDKNKAEAHLVNVDTPHGQLVLFKVKVNGAPIVVTTTPDIAMACSVGA